MLPAYFQDKSLPRPALLLGRGNKFETDIFKYPHVFAVQKAPQSWLPPPLSLQRPLSQDDCPSRRQGPAEYAWASSPARQVWAIVCAYSVWYAWLPRQHRTPPALIPTLCLRRGRTPCCLTQQAWKPDSAPAWVRWPWPAGQGLQPQPALQCWLAPTCLVGHNRWWP